MSALASEVVDRLVERLLADPVERGAEPSTLALDLADLLRGAGIVIPCLVCGGSGRVEECGACEGCLAPGEGGRFGGRRAGCGGRCPACNDCPEDDEPEDDDRHAGEGEVRWESDF